MTSAEIGPFAVEAEYDDDPENDGAPGTGSPWTGERRRWGAGGGNPNVPGAPAAPQPGPAPSSGATATPVAQSAPAPAAPPPGLALPGLPVLPLPGVPAPSAGAHPPPAQPAAGPAPAAAPVADRRAEAEPEPLVDPEMLARMAPMAMMAGATLLPMIGSALSGLTGGAGGAAPVAEGGATGMSPEAERAMKVLKLLEDMYGEGDPKDPEMKKLKEEVDGGSESSSGAGPAMLKARMLFQDNAASAFNNLDKQLVKYISGLAGSNKVDKNAVRSLVKQVNAALAELGPMAYTKEGQQKVRQILTIALQAAHKIVSGGSANAGDAASAINQLTNQYLYNLLGKELPGGVKFASGKGKGKGGAEGGSARAQHAVKTALNQVGDPYVWGAEGPNSFDCSGLMQYAAKKAGVNIPRVADDQFNSLPKVANKDIQPGDLIFPASSYKNGEMGHVMMYIGDGKCVEAPSRGKDVRVTSLPPSFAARRWA
ncbi:C40 family peptidase [Nocardia carnea]|uniref:C40 family peptidase n=1 Tax=Nocardia carnea TaxID=37328 RepID=UPI002455A8E9|nr:NlpC/P60 family protein [Nocardia carnea]